MLSTKTIESALYSQKKLARIFIAYSGGIDSHVLLHLASTIPHFQEKITAVHIHHGLQKEAENWAVHCEKIAATLNVSFLLLRVNAIATRGESPEETARNARYDALKSLIDIDDVLLVAQHREDQLETVLLQLFRGGGLRGLSGMPERMPFGHGVLIRPFLDQKKEALIEYAKTRQLSWIEDPSNLHNHFDRNFLRNKILPELKQRWPSIDKTVARSAQHCAEAQQLIKEFTANWFDLAYDTEDQTLNIAKLATFMPSERYWVLRQWFEILDLKPPSQKTLQAIVEQLLNAGESANPTIQYRNRTIKRYRQKLFCLSSQPIAYPFKPIIWPAQSDQLHLDNMTILNRVESSSGICKELWHSCEVRVSIRQGGEKLKLPGRTGHHELKKLYQEQGIPPWERTSRPLIYLNDRFAAVAGLWIDEWAWTERQNGCYRLHWLKY